MLMLSIIFLLSSNAVTLRRDKSILYVRIVITILISCFILCINSYYTDFHDKGLGLYQTTAITYIFQMFVILITGGFMLFNLNDKDNTESFLQKFKKLIKLIWNNKLNYALYLILICPIIYILSVSYTAMFNFNIDSPFILHLIRLLTIYPIFSAISTYIFSYVIKKQIICFTDALKSITLNKFILLTFFYFFGVYLGFNGYILSCCIPLLSNIFIVILDVTLDFFRLHSLSGDLLNKLPGKFILTNKVSKFTVYKGSAYNNSTTSMRVIKYKFLPKITLNGFYSNSLFSNMLHASSKSNIITFLGKKLYISEPLQIKGLNSDFKLVKINNEVYAKINLNNNKCRFVSTNLEFISLINGIGFSSNYTNTKLALSIDVSTQNSKNNIKLNDVKIKKIEYNIKDEDKVKNTLKLDIDNKINTNNNVTVYMMPNITYNNPYLNATNLAYDYNIISERSLSTLRNQIPDGVRDHILVDNIFRSMYNLITTVNDIKLFLFNNEMLIQIIKGRLNLPNIPLLNQRVELFNSSINHVLRICIPNILHFQDPVPFENIITWIYVNIGVKYPLITSTDIYQEALRTAQEFEMVQGIEFERRTKLLFGLSSERVGYAFTLYPENYHEYSKNQGNFDDIGKEHECNSTILGYMWKNQISNTPSRDEVEQVLNLNKSKLNPNDANQLESYTLGQLQAITKGAVFSKVITKLYDRSTLTLSNLNDVADLIEFGCRSGGPFLDMCILFKDLNMYMDDYLNVHSTLVTYLMNKEDVISSVDSATYWRKIHGYNHLYYENTLINQHTLNNDHLLNNDHFLYYLRNVHLPLSYENFYP